jgi:hypothetical protein
MTRRNRRAALPKRGAMNDDRMYWRMVRMFVVGIVLLVVRIATAEPAADPVRTKWESAGVSGDKLDLMVRTDGFRWRLPGGEQTDDPVKIAAAPVLFQWLVAQDPADTAFEIHTIRAYRFSRGALSITDRTYRIAAGDDPGDVFRVEAEHPAARRRARVIRVPVPVPVLVAVPR